MAEALDTFVAADDEARAECAGPLELRGDSRLHIDVELARLPDAEGVLERPGRVGPERRQALDLGGRQRQAQLDEVVGDVHSEPADLLGPRTGESLGDALEAARLVPGRGVELDPELGQARLRVQPCVLDVRRDRGGRLGRHDQPERARRASRLDPVGDAAREPGDRAGLVQDDGRQAAPVEQATHEGELPRHLVTARGGRCQGGLFGHTERHLVGETLSRSGVPVNRWTSDTREVIVFVIQNRCS